MFITLHSAKGSTHLVRHRDILTVSTVNGAPCDVKVIIDPRSESYIIISVLDTLEELEAKLNSPDSEPKLPLPFPSSLPEQANT